jgi:molybdenum cofactor synthesis domain-containing protein
MAENQTIRAAILTISDKGFLGQREDTSGPALQELLKKIGVQTVHYEVIPDERPIIAARLKELAQEGNIDLILTTGGTGVSPRDVTPEATQEVIERELPGMAEAMRARSMAITPRAMISRALAGIYLQCLIINLPGSPRGAQENLEVVLPVLVHTIEKIKGDPSECAQ